MSEETEIPLIENRNVINWHDKHYKTLLLIPAIILILSIAYLGYFYSINGDFIQKDVSLTGGTSITIFPQTEVSISELSAYLSNNLGDFSIRELTDFRSGTQKAVIIETPSEPAQIRPVLEDFLGYELDEENSSIESTGSTLSESFYLQLILSIVFSFLFMALVVLFIFGKSWKLKTLFTVLAIVFAFISLRGLVSINLGIILGGVLLLLNVLVYLRYSIPSAAVVISAFADIVMTLAFVDLIGIKISSAGIVAFLMLIGYSVDSDIMLTTRLLKRFGSTNQNLLSAFKTGITMTLTSILAVAAALLITRNFSAILNQIFTILIIGLSFDIINTWITNASVLKWYVEARK